MQQLMACRKKQTRPHLKKKKADARKAHTKLWKAIKALWEGVWNQLFQQYDALLKRMTRGIFLNQNVLGRISLMDACLDTNNEDWHDQEQTKAL